MKSIILAAGFGTRLRSITKSVPKCLIEIEGRSLLSILIEKMDEVEDLDHLVIVTNDLYFRQVSTELERINRSREITIINNGVSEANDRLGAIGDLELVIDRLSICEPILVAASDCLFTFSLSEMAKCYRQNSGNWIAAAYEDSSDLLIGGSEIEVDRNCRVTSMIEKPQNPTSNLGALPFYIFETETVSLVSKYLAGGGDSDSPGRFPEWLVQHRDLHAYIIPNGQQCEDLGSPESFFRASAVVPNLI